MAPLDYQQQADNLTLSKLSNAEIAMHPHQPQ